ncbi:MAG: two-component system phosphate regulon response regulator PhoB [Kiritimatiellia bacterium]|jgi:two-component system phosphate regulon response regulator PhoB
MEPTGPILIVDDEPDLRDLVEINLRREGFETITASSGFQALQLAQTKHPSMVILDMMLPDLSGTEVCRRLRADAATMHVPIIILSARGEEIDRVVGFEVGADDYVVKAHMSTRELVLRVRAVLRRRKGSVVVADNDEGHKRVVFGDLVIDEDAHRVWVAGEEIGLTATEFRLLTSLATRAGRVQTRGALLQDVWDMPPDLNTRTVDTHIKRLREKLCSAAMFVETVRGVGYRFNANPG